VSISLLYGCCHVETCTTDLDAARACFSDTLGAGPIEQELAKQIDSIAPGTRYRCDHVGVGEAVFQINQPDPEMVYNGHPSIHQSYLDRIGPCVTNLNFFIDDYAHARQLLESMGAATHIEGPSDAVDALADYGRGNTREGGDSRPFLFMGTRDLIGFDLEIMEPNFLRFNEQSRQYPAFVHPRPESGGIDLRLRRLRVVVGDLDATRANLARMFTPACCSRPYASREGRLGSAFCVWLGGLEIEYFQPHGSTGRLADLYASFGPGVLAILFDSDDIESALARCRGKSAAFEETDLLGMSGPTGRYQIDSRDPIGFDVVLGAASSSER